MYGKLKLLKSISHISGKFYVLKSMQLACLKFTYTIQSINFSILFQQKQSLAWVKKKSIKILFFYL